MHGFALPDLYDTDADDETINIGGPGSFDVMANAFGFNRDAKVSGKRQAYTMRAFGRHTRLTLVLDLLF